MQIFCQIQAKSAEKWEIKETPSSVQAQILTPIPSTGFMYNPHMGRLKNLTCFEVFCLISIGAFTSNTALRNCFGTLFSEIPLRQELLFRNSANEGVNILAWRRFWWTNDLSWKKPKSYYNWNLPSCNNGLWKSFMFWKISRNVWESCLSFGLDKEEYGITQTFLMVLTKLFGINTIENA